MPSVESNENVKVLIEQHNNLLRTVQASADFAAFKAALAADGATPGYTITFNPALTAGVRYPLGTE